MEMWKVSIKYDGVVEKEFVSDKNCVREWLRWMMSRVFVECGFVWKKEVNCVEDCENFEYCDIEWMFYRKGFEEKLVWENWGESRRMRERELWLW